MIQLGGADLGIFCGYEFDAPVYDSAFIND
jgi:hypothetical protein